jgi:hypothetical protein
MILVCSGSARKCHRKCLKFPGKTVPRRKYICNTANIKEPDEVGSGVVNRTMPPEKTPTQTRDMQRRTSLQEMWYGGGNCPPHPF